MWVASCRLFMILIRWRKLFSLQMVIAKCPPPRNLFRSAQHDTTNDPPRSSSGRSLVGWLCSLDLSRRLRNDKTFCWSCFIGFLQQERNIKKWNWHLASINETLWPRARRRQRRCKSRALQSWCDCNFILYFYWQSQLQASRLHNLSLAGISAIDETCRPATL